MKVYAVIISIIDAESWNSIYLDGIFSTIEKAEHRAKEIKAKYADNDSNYDDYAREYASVFVREMTLDVGNEEQRIRIR